ncbi:MAG: metal-dependent transcriptional regulator [Chloroflexaceae bacterium]
MLDTTTPRSAHPRQRRQAGLDGPTTKERDYLEVIYYLSQRDEPVIAAVLARWLNLQPSTVSHAVHEMDRKGYIQRDERNIISLTADGFGLAEEIVRRHRVLECFLADVVGMPWHLVHEEAVRLEHALSPALEERIDTLVGAATTCPHGNPIPGSNGLQPGSIRLDTAEIGTLFTIRRIEEQAEERTDLLRYLETNGIIPGNQFFIPDAAPTYGITLRCCNHDITLPLEIVTLIWGESAPIDDTRYAVGVGTTNTTT